MVGGVLVSIAWIMTSAASSLILLYIGAVVCSIGAAAVYGTCIGNILFSDLRGLAAGLTAAGFGAGSALTVLQIQTMINANGDEAAFLWFGIGQGLIVCTVSWFLRGVPDRGDHAPCRGTVGDPIAKATAYGARGTG